MHQGSFGGDPYLNHLFMFSTAFLILGIVYLGLKKHLTERFRFGFQHVLLLQSAILAPYLLMAVL